MGVKVTAAVLCVSFEEAELLGPYTGRMPGFSSFSGVLKAGKCHPSFIYSMPEGYSRLPHLEMVLRSQAPLRP